VKVRISRSARKHKLSAGRIRQALANATLVREEADAAVYVGTDDEGVEIELVVVADDRSDDGFTVIHAMPTVWRRR
jgi:hypothetical protein